MRPRNDDLLDDGGPDDALWSYVRAVCLYYLRLLRTPSLLVSLRLLLRASPRLPAVFARQRLVRVLEREAGSGRGFVREGKQWKGKVPATTLWSVDRAIMAADRLQEVQLLLARDKDDAAARSPELAKLIAELDRIELDTPPYAVLQSSLSSLRTLYLAKARLLDRAAQSCSAAENEPRLRQLWSLLRPGADLNELKTKQWQDIGFQGASPETDFRASGMLGLDCLLAFAQSDTSRAQRTIEDSVHAGAESWYPFAIASIAITRDIALHLLRLGALDLLLLPSCATGDPDAVVRTFLATHVALLRLFHAHWRALQRHRDPARRPGVMQFERILGRFRLAVAPWVERGRVGGWLDWRRYVEEEVEVGE